MTIDLLVAVSSPLSTWGGDPLDTWTISDTSNLTGGLRTITFAQGQFLAVGDGGTIATSPDGDKWTQVPSGTTLNLRAIDYADRQYVAVGGSSVGPNGTSGIFTSPDGLNWIERYRGIGLFNAVAHGNDRWVVVGGPDTEAAPILIWSDDGINWTAAKGPDVEPGVDATSLYGAAYGNGVFVAVYPGWDFSVPQSAAYVSSDGINWTRDYGVKGLRAVTFVNGQFVAVGGYLQLPWHARVP